MCNIFIFIILFIFAARSMMRTAESIMLTAIAIMVATTKNVTGMVSIVIRNRRHWQKVSYP